MAKKKSGLDVEKLKKAFFEGKLTQFLNEMLANGEDIDKDEVVGHLESFKAEQEKTVAEFKQYIDNDEVPTVEVLFNRDEDPAKVAEWIERRDYSVKRSIKILQDTARAIATRSDIDTQKFSDYAHELTGLTYFLDQDVVFKKRAWKVRQMELMEDYRCSRKEAEDYSFATNEYVEYQNAYNLRQEVENFIVNSRKELSRYQ